MVTSCHILLFDQRKPILKKRFFEVFEIFWKDFQSNQTSKKNLRKLFVIKNWYVICCFPPKKNTLRPLVFWFCKIFFLQISFNSLAVAVSSTAALLSRTSWFVLTSQVCCPAPARPSTFCPRANISHCCCRWCVMRGTERSLCSPGVGTVVCGSQTCGVSWQACGRWRHASRLLVCLFGYTWLAATLLCPHILTHTRARLTSAGVTLVQFVLALSFFFGLCKTASCMTMSEKVLVKSFTCNLHICNFKCNSFTTGNALIESVCHQNSGILNSRFKGIIICQIYFSMMF